MVTVHEAQGSCGDVMESEMEPELPGLSVWARQTLKYFGPQAFSRASAYLLTAASPN